MRPAETFALATVLSAAVTAMAGCGNKEAGFSPTALSATLAASPTGAACTAIGTTAVEGPAIVRGTACSTAASPVAILNLRTSAGVTAGSCSGVVIGTRAVLTAGHCLSSDIAQVGIDFGSGIEVPSASLHRHPGFRGVADDSLDVGVILTDRDLGRPVLPLLVSRDARVGEGAVIAGWGNDENGVSRVLRAGATTIRAVGSLYIETRASQLVSGICLGDSGGPLLVQEGGMWAAVGLIVSSSSGSCTSGTFYYSNLRNTEIASFILGLAPDATPR